MIRGIGPVYARKLVRAFGEKVFDVIEAEPERLREVTGIGRVRAKRITDAWAEQKVVREIMVFLHSHGVPAQPRRGHGAGGADIPDLRRGRRAGHDGERRRWSKLDEWLAGEKAGTEIEFAPDARSRREPPLTGATPYG